MKAYRVKCLSVGGKNGKVLRLGTKVSQKDFDRKIEDLVKEHYLEEFEEAEEGQTDDAGNPPAPEGGSTEGNPPPSGNTGEGDPPPPPPEDTGSKNDAAPADDLENKDLEALAAICKEKQWDPAEWEAFCDDKEMMIEFIRTKSKEPETIATYEGKTYEEWTVETIKEALTQKGKEFDKKALKQDLFKLLIES